MIQEVRAFSETRGTTELIAASQPGSLALARGRDGPVPPLPKRHSEACRGWTVAGFWRCEAVR